MLDGIYQSAITYFMAYLLFAPARFETSNGRGVADRERMGVFVACQTIVVVNAYVVLNSYLWSWLFLVIVVIVTSLIWVWTGIYSSFTASFQFYKAGAEVYGQLTFWTLTLLTIVICLLPRFAIKFFQKRYRPYDVDIVREQVKKGQFSYLANYESYVPPKATVSPGTSSDEPDAKHQAFDQPSKPHHRAANPSMSESQRPIYPASETTNTHNPRSQNGSDGTDTTAQSTDYHTQATSVSPSQQQSEYQQPKRPSIDRVGSSFERSRQSFDRLRPSIEASRDFTSAAQLARVESSYSVSVYSNPVTPVASRRMHDITSDLK